MSKITIGQIIKSEREKQNINKRKLSYGICTRQMLYRIEENNCNEDKFLLDILLQRLGKSPDKLEIVLNYQEYEKVRIRDTINESLLKKKYDKAEYLLEKHVSVFKNNEDVRGMFYYRTKAYIEAEKNNIEKAVEYIRKALDITLKDWENEGIDGYLISTYEMENLLFYGKLIYMMGNNKEAFTHLKQCLNYIECNFSDQEEMAKIYPKCVWLIANTLQEDDFQIIHLCENTLEKLRMQAISYFMPPIMDILIGVYKKQGNIIRAEFWERYYSILIKLYGEYQSQISLDCLFYNPYQCEYHLDYEIIRYERMARQCSQWELVDGIFKNRETLSRIENGKTIPKGMNFNSLMRALNIDKERFNGFVCTESFLIMEMKNKLDFYLSTYRLKDAEMQLKMIEEALDNSIKNNRLFIRNIRNIIQRFEGEITNEEMLLQGEALLAETYDYEKNDRVPMRNEALIIAQQISIMYSMGDKVNAISKLKRVLSLYGKSKIKIKYRSRSYGILFANYIKYLAENNKEKIAERMADTGIKRELYVGKLSILGNCLLIKGCVCENKSEEEVKSYIRDAFYLYELCYNENESELIRQYYYEVFGQEIA